MRRTTSTFTLLAVSLVLGAAACSSNSLDGKYYNSASGEFALELSHGKVLAMQGEPYGGMTYEVRADSLMIHDPRHGLADEMTFHIEHDGSLSLGILGTLTKKHP
jgi:hypothetical protein